MTPRFYIATAEKKTDFSPQLRDKIWKWPRNEARTWLLSIAETGSNEKL